MLSRIARKAGGEKVEFNSLRATIQGHLDSINKIAQRIAGAMEPDPAARICPEAYQYLDTRNLIEKPTIKIGAIVLIFLALCLVVLAVNFYLFKVGSVGLAQSLHEILRHDLGR